LEPPALQTDRGLELAHSDGFGASHAQDIDPHAIRADKVNNVGRCPSTIVHLPVQIIEAMMVISPRPAPDGFENQRVRLVVAFAKSRY
jgi:hypothetical protein